MSFGTSFVQPLARPLVNPGPAALHLDFLNGHMTGVSFTRASAATYRDSTAEADALIAAASEHGVEVRHSETPERVWA